jgi:hypothetical protein
LNWLEGTVGFSWFCFYMHQNTHVLGKHYATSCLFEQGRPITKWAACLLMLERQVFKRNILLFCKV